MLSITTTTSHTLHEAVIGVVNRAFWANLLPAYYGAVGVICRELPVSSETLTDAFGQLAKVPAAAWGKVPGFQTKDLINKVAVRAIRRAITGTATLMIQGQQLWDKLGRNPVNLIEADEANFMLPKDVVLVTAILNTKGVFVSPELLNELLEAIDKYVGLFGHRQDVATLSRRLKAMVRPIATRLQTGAGAPSPELAGLARDNADQDANVRPEGK